jgi:addiction module RelE/StbE family toxin
MRTRIQESRKAVKDLNKAPTHVVKSYEIWARLIEEHGVSILREFKGYHDEKLSGELKEYRSSRLSKSWRVIYRKSKLGKIEIVHVERVTPHKYKL